jgi:D-alanyl-D-alanine dipeptidase
MLKIVSILSLTLFLMGGCQSSLLAQENTISTTKISIPNDTKQLLLVTTDDWQTKYAKLQRLKRVGSKWQKVGEDIDIILGRNGMGWGIGLHQTPPNAPFIKKEGDGKAPAGLFSLHHAFGYEDLALNFPYQKYDTKAYKCVDDSKSKFYNTIIDSTKTVKDYDSFEYMKLDNDVYKYGIMVNHNPKQEAQKGSCIFIHLKDGTQKGTSGCTSMNESEIVDILKWLDFGAKPLILQLPKNELWRANLL